jgi:pyruvate dehydrogenase E1 component alpha subunit
MNPTNGSAALARSDIEQLYRSMLLIRKAEERLQKLFAEGLVPGFLHLSIGQEAIPTGVSWCLRNGDTVSSNHRGHGHALAKGVALEGFFAEVLGKSSGLCKGRGGSMHVADLSVGMLGANGIVGAGLPITAGSALALKMQGRGHIAVSYFGDGALAQGVFHECMNVSALWKLPMLFVCENNGWSEFSPTERQIAASLARLSSAYGVRYARVDGNQVVDVVMAARELITSMRVTPEPCVLECQTTRVRGHFEGDSQDYRQSRDFDSLEPRDAVRLAGEKLLLAGTTDTWFREAALAVDAMIESAVAAALAAPEPPESDVTADVYSAIGA